MKQTITLKNNTSSPLPLVLYFENFGAAMGDDGQITFYTQNSLQDNPSSWFAVTPPNILLGPYEQKQIVVNINVPKYVTPGGYYVSLFFEEASLNTSTTQLGIVPRLTSLFFINVNGYVYLNADIKSTQIIDKSNIKFPIPAVQGNNFEYDIDIKNNGLTHIEPHGSVNIFDSNNNLISSQPLPEHIILPNSTRKLSMNFDEHNQVLIGAYTIKTIIYYGNNHLAITSIKNFFAIPFYVIILSLTFVIIASIVVMFRRQCLSLLVFIFTKHEKN